MAQTVEVPFVTVGNRQLLTVQQSVETPWVLEFIQRFPDCFEYDADGYRHRLGIRHHCSLSARDGSVVPKARLRLPEPQIN